MLFPCPVGHSLTQSVYLDRLKPNSITLASSELAPNMFEASSELASVMEFGFNWTTRGLDKSRTGQLADTDYVDIK